MLACFNFFFKEGEKNFEILSGLGQTHSLASFGFELGLAGLGNVCGCCVGYTFPSIIFISSSVKS